MQCGLPQIKKIEILRQQKGFVSFYDQVIHGLLSKQECDVCDEVRKHLHKIPLTRYNYFYDINHSFNNHHIKATIETIASRKENEE